MNYPCEQQLDIKEESLDMEFENQFQRLDDCYCCNETFYFKTELVQHLAQFHQTFLQKISEKFGLADLELKNLLRSKTIDEIRKDLSKCASPKRAFDKFPPFLNNGKIFSTETCVSPKMNLPDIDQSLVDYQPTENHILVINDASEVIIKEEIKAPITQKCLVCDSVFNDVLALSEHVHQHFQEPIKKLQSQGNNLRLFYFYFIFLF